jgi:hypothetical protein
MAMSPALATEFQKLRARRSKRSAIRPAGTERKRFGSKRQALITANNRGDSVSTKMAQFKATVNSHSPMRADKNPALNRNKAFLTEKLGKPSGVYSGTLGLSIYNERNLEIRDF